MYDDYDGLGLLAFFLIFLPLFLLFALAGYILGSFFLMRIFDKAGVQGRWRAWVPVYNLLVLAKLGDFSPWVMLGAIVVPGLLSQVPVIGWLLSLAALAVFVAVGWRVGEKLGKEWYWLLLWLIPGVGFLIWLGILALGSSRWNPALRPAPWARTGWLTDTTVWQGVPVQPGAGVASAGGPAGYPASGPAVPGAYPPAGDYPPPGSYPPPAGAPQPPAAAYPPPGAPQPPAGPPAPPTAPPAAPPAAPPLTPEPPVSPEPPISPEPPAPGEPAPGEPDRPEPPRF